MSLTGQRQRESTGSLAVAVAAILGYGVFAQGAFYWDQLWFFAAALCVTAVVAGRRQGGRLLPAPVWVAFAVLGLALSASAAANGWPLEARVPVATLAAAVGAFGVGRATAGRGETRLLVEAIAWIGAAVALAGLIGLAFHSFPWAMRAQDLWRNASTLTYSNASGALWVLALPAAVWVVYRAPSPGARVTTFLCAAGLATSLSRGAALGLVVSVIVIAAAGGGRLLRSAVRPATAAAVATAGFIPTITGDEARPVPALTALAVGTLVAAVGARHPETARSGRRLVLAAAGGIAILAYVLATSPGVDRLVESRLGKRSHDRDRTWRAAYQAGFGRPLAGTGPGTFEVAEVADGRILRVLYAHNELLQAWVETGILGVASLIAAAALLGGWAWRGRPPPRSDARLLWITGIAPCVGFFVHGMVDFVWHIPALVAIAFVWLSATATQPHGREAQDVGSEAH